MAQAVQRDVLWADTGTLPYLARKRGPAEVAITIRAVRLPSGVYPVRSAPRALEVIRQAYPSVEPCGNALSGALMNAGPIIHPPLILMNAAPLDAERIALREALGFGPPHYPPSSATCRAPRTARCRSSGCASAA